MNRSTAQARWMRALFGSWLPRLWSWAGRLASGAAKCCPAARVMCCRGSGLLGADVATRRSSHCVRPGVCPRFRPWWALADGFQVRLVLVDTGGCWKPKLFRVAWQEMLVAQTRSSSLRPGKVDSQPARPVLWTDGRGRDILQQGVGWSHVAAAPGARPFWKPCAVGLVEGGRPLHLPDYLFFMCVMRKGGVPAPREPSTNVSGRATENFPLQQPETFQLTLPWSLKPRKSQCAIGTSGSWPV